MATLPLSDCDASTWEFDASAEHWPLALESGQVLHFTHLPFPLSGPEKSLFLPTLLSPRSRNISLDVNDCLKGASADPDNLNTLVALIGRFRTQALHLIHSIAPQYRNALRLAPTSFRPLEVKNRHQSWRADDRRLHVDAFPSRPNGGERILRVFLNINPEGAPRVWRIGEPFEAIAAQFLKRAKPYVGWQAKLLHQLKITKSLRHLYDHQMLQLHDAMKADSHYQEHSTQQTVAFASGAVWVCFSDQTSHAVMSGQYLLEQTFHLPVSHMYHPELSPLHILKKLSQKK